MATIRKSWAGTASTTLENLIAGSKFEFPERNYAVRIFAVIDATGVNQELMDVTAGTQIIADAVELPKYTDGQGPNRNEHLITRFTARAGRRIQIKLRETVGLAAPTRVLIDIDEIF